MPPVLLQTRARDRSSPTMPAPALRNRSARSLAAGRPSPAQQRSHSGLAFLGNLGSNAGYPVMSLQTVHRLEPGHTRRFGFVHRIKGTGTRALRGYSGEGATRSPDANAMAGGSARSGATRNGRLRAKMPDLDRTSMPARTAGASRVLGLAPANRRISEFPRKAPFPQQSAANRRRVQTGTSGSSV